MAEKTEPDAPPNRAVLPQPSAAKVTAAHSSNSE